MSGAFSRVQRRVVRELALLVFYHGILHGPVCHLLYAQTLLELFVLVHLSLVAGLPLQIAYLCI